MNNATTASEVMRTSYFRSVKRLVALATFAAVVGSASLVVAAETVVGRWKTVDENTGKVVSEVELYEQDGWFFGRIAGLSEPKDKQGKPKTCTRCTGADKDKPLIGLVIIRDLRSSDGRYKGTILDPEDGKVHKVEIWAEDGNLKVRGYVGFVFKTHTWVRGT